MCLDRRAPLEYLVPVSLSKGNAFESVSVQGNDSNSPGSELEPVKTHSCKYVHNN